ncbi:hypothetical protein DENSPDRAFT_323267 [Dentipellis sp. KUC8613]|nr:hypothetical protein DENSPDRAFT_323267 [Dentipellis sp. KUC8613]
MNIREPERKKIVCLHLATRELEWTSAHRYFGICVAFTRFFTAQSFACRVMKTATQEAQDAYKTPSVDSPVVLAGRCISKLSFRGEVRARSPRFLWYLHRIRKHEYNAVRHISSEALKVQRQFER